MNPGKKSGLGRGLEALFNDVQIEVPSQAEEKDKDKFTEGGIVYNDINLIKPNSNQPRKNFDAEKIEELAQSITENGIIQPILVRKSGKGYEIVAGERRWRAARNAGLKEVPCIIREIDDKQNLLIALIENLQREDLNIIEEAAAFQQMSIQYKMTQQQISESVGKSRPHITNSMRLLKLPDEVKEKIVCGHITGGHAKAIAGIDDVSKQIALTEEVIRKGLSVRQTEVLAGSIANNKPRPKSRVKPQIAREIAYVENQLKSALGTKVKIKPGVKVGKIEIEYYDKDELNRLIEYMLER